MVECNTINAKLPDSQLNKLKSAVRNKQGTTLRMNVKMFSANNIIYYKYIIIYDIKLSKAQISKIVQSGGFLGSLLSKIAGPLMKVAIPQAKNILAPLGITTAASAIDAGIQKKYVALEQQL